MNKIFILYIVLIFCYKSFIQDIFNTSIMKIKNLYICNIRVLISFCDVDGDCFNFEIFLQAFFSPEKKRIYEFNNLFKSDQYQLSLTIHVQCQIVWNRQMVFGVWWHRNSLSWKLLLLGIHNYTYSQVLSRIPCRLTKRYLLLQLGRIPKLYWYF